MNDLGRLRTGLILALLTLLFGSGLGIAFGAAEDALKGHLAAEGRAALDTVYDGDETAMKKTVDKSWVYFKRAHLHANGLGTSALAMVLLIAAIPGAGIRWRSITATALGVGSLGYSVYWLLAGLKAPGMGSTSAARESLDWLAIPTSGLCVVGLLSVIVMVVVALSTRDEPKAATSSRDKLAE